MGSWLFGPFPGARGLITRLELANVLVMSPKHLRSLRGMSYLVGGEMLGLDAALSTLQIFAGWVLSTEGLFLLSMISTS